MKKVNELQVCAVSVMSNGDQLEPFVFRSYGFQPHSASRYAGDASAQIWQVVRATTAAPFLFNSFKFRDMVLRVSPISSHSELKLRNMDRNWMDFRMAEFC